MRHHSYWTGLFAFAAVTAAWGGPVNGPPSKDYPIDAARAEPTVKEFTQIFRGGERACVFARGDHKPLVPLSITVYDKDGATVAHDASPRDFVAAFWVPARTAEYRIVVRNHGKEEFEGAKEGHKYTYVYVVFK